MGIAGNGILIIDKPEGITSAKVVGRLKRLPGIRKVGHAGTLDPFATGVLICCINQATRLAGFFLKGEKRYSGVVRLGVETDTQDGTGKIVAKKDIWDEKTKINLSEERIKSVLRTFQGEIQQTPPSYSALKHNGVPLYKLARKGKMIQKPPRSVVIFSLSVVRIDLPDIEIDVSCSAGTYIRTLAADFGSKLGCGAHLCKLRRTASSGFSEDRAVSLENAERVIKSGKGDRILIPSAEALSGMTEIKAEKELENQIRVGKRLKKNFFTESASNSERWKGYFRVIGGDGNLLAVLRKKKDDSGYDYCCVFPRESDNKMT